MLGPKPTAGESLAINAGGSGHGGVQPEECSQRQAAEANTVRPGLAGQNTAVRLSQATPQRTRNLGQTGWKEMGSTEEERQLGATGCFAGKKETLVTK